MPLAFIPGQPSKPIEWATRAAKHAPAGKRHKLAALLLRPGGATRMELLDASGWTAISVQSLATAAGLKLRQEKEGGSFRYFGSR